MGLDELVFIVTPTTSVKVKMPSHSPLPQHSNLASLLNSLLAQYANTGRAKMPDQIGPRSEHRELLEWSKLLMDIYFLKPQDGRQLLELVREYVEEHSLSSQYPPAQTVIRMPL